MYIKTNKKKVIKLHILYDKYNVLYMILLCVQGTTHKDFNRKR